MTAPKAFYDELAEIAREAYQQDRKRAIKEALEVLAIAIIAIAASILILIW